jgi:hypothetical protein
MANLNDFARDLSTTTSFVVENIAVPDKLVRVFQFPIPIRGTRDLLKIRGVGEADIRASLLKGELRVKILAKEIRVVQSDIDLLQFNLDEKSFLQSAGVVDGLEVSAGMGEHSSLRDLIHFIDDGPADGFESGAYKVVLGQPFPTSITWYADNTQTAKIVEKLIVRNGMQNPTSITWNMYDVDGSTILHTIIDAITYTDNTFESTRTRTIL